MSVEGDHLAKCFIHLVVFVTTFLLGVLSRQTIPPIITVHPDKDVTFVLHNAVMLSCQASGDPAPSYHWTKNDVKLDTNTTDVYIQDDGNLVIERIKKEDQGVYHCWASNKGGTDRSRPATLSLAFLDPFPFKEPETRLVDLGADVVLNCNHPASNPDPELMWYKKDDSDNMKPVIMGNGIILDLTGNLHLLAFDQMDAGVYICICFNHVLRNQVHDHTIELIPRDDQASFGSKPVSLEWRSKTPAFELVGNTLKIQCIFGSNPPPTISWQRINSNLPADRHEVINEGTTLVLTNLQLEDTGTYECVAFNELSLEPVIAEIQVIVRAVPRFVTRPMSTNVTAGQAATFKCAAKGSPSPGIAWFINWQDIATKPQVSTTTSTQEDSTVTSMLHVTKATSDDSMVVTCLASNQYGAVNSSSYLSVNETVPVIGSSSSRLQGDLLSYLMTFCLLYKMQCPGAC